MNHQLEAALHRLNKLIDQGWEFPEALDTTLRAFELDSKALVDAYDAQ